MRGCCLPGTWVRGHEPGEFIVPVEAFEKKLQVGAVHVHRDPRHSGLSLTRGVVADSLRENPYGAEAPARRSGRPGDGTLVA